MDSKNTNILRVYRTKARAKKIMTKSVIFMIVLPVDSRVIRETWL